MYPSNIRERIKNNDLLLSTSMFTREPHNALAIFITQVQFDGLKEENLFILNYSLIEYCNRENLNCIDLGKKLDGKLDFFYDLAHTTKLGSQVIAETVINDLTQIIERENLFSSNLKSD